MLSKYPQAPASRAAKRSAPSSDMVRITTTHCGFCLRIFAAVTLQYRHVEIHQYQIRFELPGHFYSYLPVFRLPDHLIFIL